MPGLAITWIIIIPLKMNITNGNGFNPGIGNPTPLLFRYE